MKRKIIISGPINAEGQSLKKELELKFPNTPVEFTKSAVLELEASSEDNYLKALGIGAKAIREKRAEKFEDWFDKIISHPSVLEWSERDNNSLTFNIPPLGVIDFFPKANNLLIRRQNKWKKPGLRWLLNHLNLK